MSNPLELLVLPFQVMSQGTNSSRWGTALLVLGLVLLVVAVVVLATTEAGDTAKALPLPPPPAQERIENK